MELYLGVGKAFQIKHICQKRSQGKGRGDWEGIEFRPKLPFFDLIQKEVGVVSCVIQSSPLVFTMESPRPVSSGSAWPLRPVLFSHLAVPRCGSWVRRRSLPYFPTVSQCDSSQGSDYNMQQ